MPHTTNLVTQFEDIIRRGGNELESNIVSVVRGGWVRKSGSRRKIAPQDRFRYEEDESPPPIPRRAPLSINAVTYSTVPDKTSRTQNIGSHFDTIPMIDAEKNKVDVFTIDDEGQVS